MCSPRWADPELVLIWKTSERGTAAVAGLLLEWERLSVGSVIGQRQRRWPITEPTLSQRPARSSRHRRQFPGEVPLGVGPIKRAPVRAGARATRVQYYPEFLSPGYCHITIAQPTRFHVPSFVCLKISAIDFFQRLTYFYVYYFPLSVAGNRGFLRLQGDRLPHCYGRLYCLSHNDNCPYCYDLYNQI